VVGVDSVGVGGEGELEPDGEDGGGDGGAGVAGEEGGSLEFGGYF